MYRSRLRGSVLAVIALVSLAASLTVPGAQAAASRRFAPGTAQGISN